MKATVKRARRICERFQSLTSVSSMSTFTADHVSNSSSGPFKVALWENILKSMVRFVVVVRKTGKEERTGE